MPGRLNSSQEPSEYHVRSEWVQSLFLLSLRSQLLLQGCLLPEAGEPKSEECEVWKRQIGLAGLLSWSRSHGPYNGHHCTSGPGHWGRM